MIGITFIIIIIIVIVLVIIELVKMRKGDNFTNDKDNKNDNDKDKDNKNATDNLIHNFVEISDKYKMEIVEELIEYKNMKFPLILDDEGNFCKDYSSDNVCIPNKKNTRLFNCDNNPEQYCNNWMTPEIYSLQIIDVDEIVKSNIDNSNLVKNVIDELDNVGKIVKENSNMLDIIKAKSLLSNSQKYFLDNNEYNLTQREEQLTEKRKQNIEYDNAFTKSKFYYQNANSQKLKYKKYLNYLTYILYSLIIILAIICIVNFLFTTF